MIHEVKLDKKVNSGNQEEERESRRMLSFHISFQEGLQVYHGIPR